MYLHLGGGKFHKVGKRTVLIVKAVAVVIVMIVNIAGRCYRSQIK